MATAMLFGPEWMRTKQGSSARPSGPSPPPLPSLSNGNGQNNSSSTPPVASSYSSLVTPISAPAQPKQDVSHPFKYSKDQMLAVWKELGGGGPLPIEVERWEGVVREEEVDPMCAHEMSESEKKLFSTPLNSEARRRQSTDHGVQGDRPKLHSSRSSQGGSALGDGLGLLGRRRRGDSIDNPQLSLARKSSWTAVPGSIGSPGLGSPRSARVGGAPGANGFDGVLSSSDSPWTSTRRRMSSNQVNVSKSDSENEASTDSVIKEEPEAPDDSNATDVSNDRQPSHESASSLQPSLDYTHSSEVNDVTEKLNQIPLGDVHDYTPRGGNDPPVNDLQSKAFDSTTLNWTYLDPLGNIQGPFTAETMQTWHDQQYFTDDLRMKRVGVDNDWISVADIKLRALGKRIFLSPLSEVPPPPGLSRLGIGLPRNGIFRDASLLDSPRQPTPQGYGLSHLVGGSASPASSYGMPAFNGLSGSPDQFSVGGRMGSQTFSSTELPVNGRVSSGGYSSPNTSILTNQPMQHSAIDPYLRNQPMSGEMHRSASYEAQNLHNNVLLNVPWQTPMNQGQAWDQQVPEQSRFLSQGGISSDFNRTEPFLGASASHLSGNVFDQHVPSPDMFNTSGSNFNARTLGDFASQSTTGQVGMAESYAPLQPISMPSHPTSLNQTPSEQPVPSTSSAAAPSPLQVHTRQAPWSAASPSQESRPRPFDADRPRASNTFSSGPTTFSARPKWMTVETESPSVTPQQAPWLSTEAVTTGNNWVQMTDEPQSLTTANVQQHNEGQNESTIGAMEKQAPDTTSLVVQAPTETLKSMPSTAFARTSAMPATPTIQQHQAQAQAQPVKRKQSSSAQATTPQKQQVVIPPAQPRPVVVSPAASTQGKSAWTVADDADVKTPAPIGLREIQEAEKKKQDARRQAEKEREKSARIAAAVTTAPAQAEEVQFSTSWGLPTSLAGARKASFSSGKESPAAAQGTPVWTNAQPVAKKTMKEIQEEEERRRVLAGKERESVATAAKKTAAAAAAAKIVTASSPANTHAGGAWTVVGSGGKSVANASPVTATRPNTVSQALVPGAASVPAPAPVRQQSATTINRPVSVAQVTKTVPAAAVSVEETPNPSADFLTWLRESLRGLNSSVQFEDVAQMLLSFPLDPDPSTIELIRELIYGSSTTLDGRRFTAEFIAKRKADAARPRPPSAAVGGNGKTSSLADVVRTQPKAAPANEFGSFKVVKKKGKRS